MSSAIVLDNVTKRFGQTVAVDALSLEVPEGAIYGFIGPNGSGKTTTLRMIMRILHARPRADARARRGALTTARDRVGYLPEERGLYKQMTVRDSCAFYAALKGGRRADVARDADGWLDRLGLPGVADKKVQALSKGMSQKVQFIATVVARPNPGAARRAVQRARPGEPRRPRETRCSNSNGDGTTIIFSTHDMSVAEMMCDFIFMIYRGRKVLDGSLDQIQATYGHDTVRVRVEGGAAVLADRRRRRVRHRSRQRCRRCGCRSIRRSSWPTRSSGDGAPVRAHAAVAARHLHRDRQAVQ